MLHIPTSFVARFTLKQHFVDLMTARGYAAFQAHGSGAWILMHPRRHLVLKVGDDGPTQQFAAFMSGVVWRPELPRVFATTGSSSSFTIIVMERLSTFPDERRYDDWLNNDYVAHKGKPLGDPFGAVGYLAQLARDAVAHGVDLDAQGKNVMLRRRTSQLVFFDPFG